MAYKHSIDLSYTQSSLLSLETIYLIAEETMIDGGWTDGRTDR